MTAKEHGELARKFKYYYASVRPQERNNRVTDINGTFFALNCDLKIISTKPYHVFFKTIKIKCNKKVHMEIIFGVTFIDERLIIRELKNRFRLPAEYYPWLPEIITYPYIPINTVIYLDPSIGIVDALYRYSVEILCSSEIWRHPFELFQCEFVISNIGDERIFLRDFQDLRNTEQISKVSVNVETFKEIRIIVSYPELWFSSMVANILPSTIIFCVVIFAQYMDIVKSSLLMRQLTLSHDTSTKQTEMTQQQIKIAALGLRKRLSLAIITCCYFVFVITYFMLALYLILKQKNFL
ncbi:unnamed protein product [Wuchereria bancrofti]|uniref:Neurotransmitter-gated ion-channel ligand-binding domain-containing protein n=1 Tax=Wuchereria bancrofti TaxID=6293 RepID=A0A3P7DJZ4_WUCBA|nr:unnamed protein product [Wuchereria bancrofti]